MFNICFVEHKLLTQKVLDEIIKVKSVAWPYHYDEQCKWIKNNLKNSDIHVLLYKDRTLIAYLNLVEIEIQFDSANFKGFGVGNVCATEKGKGWGKILISNVNSYLIDNNLVGLLFCKDQLIKFYIDCEWMLIFKQDILSSSLVSKVNAFIYNSPENFKQIKYEGTLF